VLGVKPRTSRSVDLFANDCATPHPLFRTHYLSLCLFTFLSLTFLFLSHPSFIRFTLLYFSSSELFFHKHSNERTKPTFSVSVLTKATSRQVTRVCNISKHYISQLLKRRSVFVIARYSRFVIIRSV